MGLCWKCWNSLVSTFECFWCYCNLSTESDVLLAFTAFLKGFYKITEIKMSCWYSFLPWCLNVFLVRISSLWNHPFCNQSNSPVPAWCLFSICEEDKESPKVSVMLYQEWMTIEWFWCLFQSQLYGGVALWNKFRSWCCSPLHILHTIHCPSDLLFFLSFPPQHNLFTQELQDTC